MPASVAREKMLQVAVDYERMADNADNFDRNAGEVDRLTSNPEVPKPRWAAMSRDEPRWAAMTRTLISLSFLGSVVFEFWKNELAETVRVTLAGASTFDYHAGYKLPDRFVTMW
jgi:hypothetical protein